MEADIKEISKKIKEMEKGNFLFINLIYFIVYSMTKKEKEMKIVQYSRGNYSFIIIFESYIFLKGLYKYYYLVSFTLFYLILFYFET